MTRKIAQPVATTYFIIHIARNRAVEEPPTDVLKHHHECAAMEETQPPMDRDRSHANPNRRSRDQNDPTDREGKGIAGKTMNTETINLTANPPAMPLSPPPSPTPSPTPSTVHIKQQGCDLLETSAHVEPTIRSPNTNMPLRGGVPPGTPTSPQTSQHSGLRGYRPYFTSPTTILKNALENKIQALTPTKHHHFLSLALDSLPESPSHRDVCQLCESLAPIVLSSCAPIRDGEVHSLIDRLKVEAKNSGSRMGKSGDEVERLLERWLWVVEGMERASASSNVGLRLTLTIEQDVIDCWARRQERECIDQKGRRRLPLR